MIIAVDFDGTCVTHEYPKIGRDIGAVPVLLALTEKGHQLILHTMRSDAYLMEAVGWFKENKIPLYGVNTNPTQKQWTNSSKAFAHLYIDDAALGCPTCKSSFISNRPFVDWDMVAEMLEERGLL